METKQFEAYSTDELFCLYNCVRESLEYVEFDNKSLGEYQNFKFDFAEKLRKSVRIELHKKPDVDPELWVLTAKPGDMSARAISETEPDVLECFVTCITIALKYLDDEDQFFTRIGVTMKFARSLQTAVSNELSNRSANMGA